MMKTHYLKTWPEHFASVKSREKKAELRWNDRDFKVGDTLCLEEYDPDVTGYTGQREYRTITHILSGPGFGLAANFVMMSLEPELPY